MCYICEYPSLASRDTRHVYKHASFAASAHPHHQENFWRSCVLYNNAGPPQQQQQTTGIFAGTVCVHGPSCSDSGPLSADTHRRMRTRSNSRWSSSPPGFANPMQVWNTKVRSYLALDGKVPHLVHLLYEHALAAPAEYLHAALVQRHAAQVAPCFADRDAPSKQPLNGRTRQQGMADWHQLSRGGHQGLYLGAAAKFRAFYERLGTFHGDVAFINAELDPYVLGRMGIERWEPRQKPTKLRGRKRGRWRS